MEVFAHPSENSSSLVRLDEVFLENLHFSHLGGSIRFMLVFRLKFISSSNP